MRSSNEPPEKRSRLSVNTIKQPQKELPLTPSTNVAEATSPGSRADYTCYTIRGAGGVLAVVIETEMEQSSQDALAQVYPHSLPEHITPVPTYTAGNGVRRCI